MKKTKKYIPEYINMAYIINKIYVGVVDFLYLGVQSPVNPMCVVILFR